MKSMGIFLEELKKEVEDCDPITLVCEYKKFIDDLAQIFGKIAKFEGDLIILRTNQQFITTKTDNGNYSAKPVISTERKVCRNWKRKRNYDKFYYKEAVEDIESLPVTHYYKSLVVKDNVIGEFDKGPGKSTRSHSKT